MIRIPDQFWPQLDRAINAARRERNDGVPQQFHEMPTAYAVGMDRLSKKYVVTAVRFPGGAEVRVRRAERETWRQFA